MQKLDMQTPDIASMNIEAIAKLFPSVVTEKEDTEGNIVKAVDFDLLKQMLSKDLVEDSDERYRLDWPGKKASILKANTPINKTLRPVREDSVNFDTTENLYIEGDNFEVLKVLQESYLGKVKMIYIDPPYNTGKDFVYMDNFSKSREEYEEELEITDEEGGRLIRNTDSNGRFHSDWLSMMHERLLVARDLLRDDGVIFMSIDDNEVHNLRKVADEVFGEDNAIGPIIQNKLNSKNDTLNVQRNHEYILIYRKKEIISNWATTPSLICKKITRRELINQNWAYFYLSDPITTRGEGWTLSARPNLGFSIYYNQVTWDIKAVADYNLSLAKTSDIEEEVYSTDSVLISQGYECIRPPRVRWKLGAWTWEMDKINKQNNDVYIKKTKNGASVHIKRYVDSSGAYLLDWKYYFDSINEFWNSRSVLDFSTNEWTDVFNQVLEHGIFDNPKNLAMIQYLISLMQQRDGIILDFFSGSATTAHAAMQLNAEDGWNRKFIMVQIPEETDPTSEAFKAGYKNICEIGKERIRRSGKKILEENKDKPGIEKLDVGFRVFRLDSSNMKDVYYHPTQITQAGLFELESNIKEDRSGEDVLAQVMLDFGLPLDLPIERKTISGNTVFFVAGNSLVACFDENVDFSLVDEIAKCEPLKVVFRDSSFRTDADRINFETRFKKLSPETDVRVI